MPTRHRAAQFTAMTDPVPDDTEDLHTRAYAAMDRGALSEASRDFEALLQLEPGNRYYHYMRGLAHKYLLDWPASLHHNLQAIELADEMGGPNTGMPPSPLQRLASGPRCDVYGRPAASTFPKATVPSMATTALR